MTRRALLVLVLLAAVPPGRADDGTLAPAQAPPAVEWLGGYFEAYAKARMKGRPIFVFFTACWSPSCRAIEAGALADPAVREELGGYACVRVDMDGDSVTPARFGVRRLPGLLLLDRDEKPLVPALTDVSPAGVLAALRAGREEFPKRP